MRRNGWIKVPVYYLYISLYIEDFSSIDNFYRHEMIMLMTHSKTLFHLTPRKFLIIRILRHA